MDKIIGIYQIQSKIKPYRIYIGSASNMINRWRCHLSYLKKNNHHSKKLQNHYNKYGEIDLTFSIIELCNSEKLVLTEQYYIDLYKPYFNICPFAGRTAGVIKSAETCKKISEGKKGKPSSRKGFKTSDETKLKLRNANLGKEMSEETKAKISLTTKNKKKTDAHRLNISKGLKGKKKSPEHLEKIRLAQTGKKRGPMPEEIKAKLSKARMGHSVSAETRKKLSDFNKGKKQSEEARDKNRLSNLGRKPWNTGMTKEEQLEYSKKKRECVLVV